MKQLFDSSVRVWPQVVVPMAGEVSFTNDSLFRCAQAARFTDTFGGLYGPNAYLSTFLYSPWNLTDPDNNQQQPCTYLISTLQFGCVACPVGTYVLTPGYSNGSAGTAVNPDCLSCPFGGVCSANGAIASQPGYWGGRTPSGYINFTLCPPAYCCTDDKSCVDIHSCHGNRTGPLCGDCLPGYSEGLLSTTCVPTSQCASDVVSFWPLAVLGIFADAFLQLLFASHLLPHVRSACNGSVLVWKRMCCRLFGSRCCGGCPIRAGGRLKYAGAGSAPSVEKPFAPESEEVNDDADAADDAKFKVFSYFAQVRSEWRGSKDDGLLVDEVI